MAATWSLHDDFPPHVGSLAEPGAVPERPDQLELMFGDVRYYNAEFKEIVGPQGVVYLWWPVPGGKNEFSVTAFSPRTQRMTMKHRTFRPDEEARATAYARGLATEILAEMDRAGLILDAPAQA